ncbi:MAG: N-acetyltransferase, partial [Rhodobacteraceae bacterium]|nr:N-acetyltransferase [Paracoccaceae bacterium]
DASLQAVRDDSDSASIVLLVGDLDYYKRFGFTQVSAEKVVMPRPVEIGRILACELEDGAFLTANGRAERWK